MLNIYYGSETIDKEKFMFEHIKGKTLLLVPDQFSLQAERDAFFYLGKKSLIDIRIVDFSALGYKVVNEVGGSKPPLIDKYGRHMLLTRIIGSMEDRLNIYKGLSGKASFVDMMNSMISEMKRFEVEPTALTEALHTLDEKSFLRYKLEDIEKIYSAYQEAIEGKYLDSEDYITFYGEKILSSQMVAESDIWIYGFDTFTPKNLLVIERLLKTAKSVNVVMTYDEEVGYSADAAFLTGVMRDELFSLTGYVIKMLEALAEELNEEHAVQEIRGEKRKSIWAAARPQARAGEARAENATLESPAAEKTTTENTAAGGFAKSPTIEKATEENTAAGSFAVTMVEASNIYTEAERAAAYILELVRDEGYKFGEIVVVCNDTEIRGAALRRTFLRWGIPVFMDKKRKVLHHPAVSFLLAFMAIVAKGYKDDAVMGLLKSGLLGIADDEAELLENYLYEYKIRGSMWKADFIRGGNKYNAEDLNVLNKIRRGIVDITEAARNDIGRRNTAAEKIKGLYKFLKDDFMMMERLEAVMDEQEAFGLTEGAAETAQSWNVLCGILDQIVETIGEERISNEELAELMAAGFEEVEIGLVPVNSDSVMIGTLQRTRLSNIRALLVTSANEGILPLERSAEGLLNEREKEALEELELEVSKREDVIRQEERLAIYRTFSLPEEKLYVSCSGDDGAGEEQRPSAVFNALKTFLQANAAGMFLGDLDAEAGVFGMLASKSGALSYMANAFRNSEESGGLDCDWLQVVNWYEENDRADIDRVKSGMSFNNRLEVMGRRFADALYRGDKESLEVSASRLEKYSGCPFAHFVGYGLRAEEPRVFEMGAREIGDVYHECLMKFSRSLTPDERSGMAADDPQSGWMTVSREECRAKIEQIINEDLYDYREGLLGLNKAEEYRTERITEICSQIAWSMVGQVRKGCIRSMSFEKPFGRGCELPPVKVDVGGREVLIQGKIDRIDVLRSEQGRAGKADSAANVKANDREINGRGINDGDANVGEISVVGAVARGDAKADEGAVVDGSAVRIVDYKTGAEAVNVDYFRSGYKLQLMVYLKAAMQADMQGDRVNAYGNGDTERYKSEGGEQLAMQLGADIAVNGTVGPADGADIVAVETVGIADVADTDGIDNTVGIASAGGTLRPAGVFHFRIKDPDIDADAKAIGGGDDALQQRVEDVYRLEGVVLNDSQIIDAMDRRFDGASQVIPVKRKKDGSFAASAGGCLLSDAEFRELYRQVDAHVVQICREICDGNIEIQPKRENTRDMDGGYRNSCKFCSYKSICMFDTAFEGCRFKKV